MSRQMQGFDNACLLRRRAPCADGDSFQPLRQFLISQFLYITAEKNVVGWHPHRAANFAGNDVVIAGQDLDPDPGTGQGRDRNAGALLWRMPGGDIAEQGKTALVLGSVARVGAAALFISDRNHPKPISIEPCSLLLHLGEMARIEGGGVAL